MANQKINEYLHHTLREDFTSPNPEVRKGAIYALGRLGSGPDVLLVLKNIAAQDPDPEVRYTAKKALSYWEGVLQGEGESKSVEVRIKQADGTLDTEALDRALRSTVPAEQIGGVIEAVKLGSPGALSPLHRLVREEQDPWVLAIGIKALGSLGGLDEVAVVTNFLKHQNHRVVANAIESLEMLGDETLPDKLRPFLASEDNRIRANAAKALYPLNPNLAFETVEAMATDHRPWMRASAAYVLKVLQDPRCEELLQAMVQAEYAPELLRQLLEALTAQASSASVGFLGHMAESADGERSRLARVAFDMLVKRLGLAPADLEPLLAEARSRHGGPTGGRSGAFTVGDLGERPRAPAVAIAAVRGAVKPLPAKPIGYGEAKAEGPAEDPGVRQALAIAVGLALLAAAFVVGRYWGGTGPKPPPPSAPSTSQE